MKDHFTQFEDGVSDDTKPASAIEVVVATVVLALLLQIFWRCCSSSFHRNEQVKKFQIPSSSTSGATMDPSKIAAVEKILNYTFKDKRLLVEALTHPSCRENTSYDRLEFIGDAALDLTVATHFFCKEPNLNSHQLTQLRIESVNNDRLAIVAGKHRLYRFVRCKDTNPHNAKILAEVVESLAGAVYLDVNFDLTKLWKIFEDVLMMHEITVPIDYRTSAIINGAQDELYGLCGKKRGWRKPQYSYVKEEGRRNETKHVCLVEIETDDGVLSQMGDEKSTPKDARNSAAYRMLRALQQ